MSEPKQEVCKGCGKLIDRDYCWCGDEMAAHSQLISHSCERCGRIRTAKLSHGLGRICRQCYSPDPELSKAIRETQRVLVSIRRDFKIGDQRGIYEKRATKHG